MFPDTDTAVLWDNIRAALCSSTGCSRCKSRKLSPVTAVFICPSKWLCVYLLSRVLAVPWRREKLLLCGVELSWVVGIVSCLQGCTFKLSRLRLSPPHSTSSFHHSLCPSLCHSLTHLLSHSRCLAFPLCRINGQTPPVFLALVGVSHSLLLFAPSPALVSRLHLCCLQSRE